MTDKGPVSLNSDLHGRQCLRGEISLNAEEFASLQPYISPDFRFVPINDEKSTQPLLKKFKTGFSSLNNSKDDIISDKRIPPFNELTSPIPLNISDETRKPREKKVNMKYSASGATELITSPQMGNASQLKKISSHFKSKSDPSLKENLKNNPIQHQPLNTINSALPSEPFSKYPKIPITTPSWNSSCQKILHEFKRKDGSNWFILPVSPDIDGVPDYLNIITHPMDFKSIEEKLLHGIYRNPYEWQQDFRQIFYNAFKYHSAKNQVWQDAIKLAREFEQIIINIAELKFNSNIGTSTLEASEDQISTFTEKQTPPHSKELHGAFSSIKELKKGSNNLRESTNFQSADPIDSTNHKTLKLVDKQHSDKVSNNTIDISEYEIPESGFVPPPPPIQKIGINDKSLSNTQRKQLQSNLTKLAPNQRLAALELVQDDIGILAKIHATEINFKLDPDLLSIEKQKRIHLYVNQMVRSNTEAFLQKPHNKLNNKVDIRQIDSDFTIKNQDPRSILDPHNKTNNSSASDDYEVSSSSSSFSSSSSSTSDSNSEYEEVGKYLDENLLKVSGSSGSSDRARRITLPEYTPVSESDQALQISEDVMGRHADFLGHMETQSNQRYSDFNKDPKYSAWADWKGQVIKQVIISQREGAPPRNKDEIIAESYDARI